MRLPDFLIIGAMKSGTTSLYADLGTHPAVFFPDDKEPDALAGDEVLTESGRAAYAGLFTAAGDDQLCAEASTAYSKLPDIPGVAPRARRLLGGDLKVLYLVREPVSRIISQHYHELAGGAVDPDIDRAVRDQPRLIHYSLYAKQILPWLETFGEERVRIVRFESYIADRRAGANAVFDFLGLQPVTAGIDTDRVHNPSAQLRARRGVAWRFAKSAFYRRWIRPRLSRPLRTRLRLRVTPSAPPRPRPPSLATVDYILDEIARDVASLPQLAGWSEPLWDLDAVRQRFAEGVAN
jgi:hypothetical protein